MLKEDLIISITKEMTSCLTNLQMITLEETIRKNFENVQITKITDELKEQEERASNKTLIEAYISSKKVEGCSNRTLNYYNDIVQKFVFNTKKPIKDICTDDIRNYLSTYKETSNCTEVTIDNLRRVFSSFFSWLEDEDYIIKSPVRRIHKVKTAKVIKETFTDESIEKMRDTCDDIRNLAIVEFLISTGVRVGELVNLNKADINYEERSCVVLGKGNKQREVYFDAKTKLHLLQCINQRNDENSALFVSNNKPHQRLSIAGIELIVKKLGKELDINKVHPHKFRRTLATMAIDKGMPIEQVQKLLGHVKIETTMHYAMVNQNNVKISHRKYIG